MILAFDWETTAVRDPRPVELGAVLVELDGTERASVSLVVRPEGWLIPDDAARVHGVTTAEALRCGVPLAVALAALTNLWSLAVARVAHNLKFDDEVTELAFRHLGRSSSLVRPPGVCTMGMAAPVLDLPPTERMLAAGYDKPKPPSLKEAYQFLFGEDPVDAHRALADARACARVYLELVNRGVTS